MTVMNTFEYLIWGIGLVAAGAAGAATAAAGLAQVEIGIQVETHSGEVDFYPFCLFHEIFVHNKFVAFDIVGIVGIFRLIQSHGKGGAASAAGIEKNSDRGGFFPLEIVIDLRFGRISQLNHW